MWGPDILVFPQVLRLAHPFSFLDLYPIIGEALYLSVEPEVGTRGGHKNRNGRAVPDLLLTNGYLL